MTSVEIRPLWRAAAFAALVAFLWLPRGHLAGHDEISAARAEAAPSGAAIAAAAFAPEGGERLAGCSLCLSLAKVRTSLAAIAGVAGGAPAAASPLAVTGAPHVAEAFVSAHTAPRAPPAA